MFWNGYHTWWYDEYLKETWTSDINGSGQLNISFLLQPKFSVAGQEHVLSSPSTSGHLFGFCQTKTSPLQVLVCPGARCPPAPCPALGKEPLTRQCRILILSALPAGSFPKWDLNPRSAVTQSWDSSLSSLSFLVAVSGENRTVLHTVVLQQCSSATADVVLASSLEKL